MPGGKSIVLGCDDTITLSRVLGCIKETHLVAHHIISATRVSDLMGIAKSLKPDLIILCFRNNQMVLHDVVAAIGKSAMPLLCLTKDHECQTLSWGFESIVFTCPFNHIFYRGYLALRINSIFMLKTEMPKETEPGTFAEAAIQRNHSGDSRSMSRYVLELDQKVEILVKLKDRIAELYPSVDDRTRAELTSIVNYIKMSANDTKLWDDFKVYFEQTNPDFLYLLAENYPGLTPIDLKYCCYLKMNMSNDDIRNLLGINQESVRTHKYRLKRKMSLTKNQDLRGFLRAIGHAESLPS